MLSLPPITLRLRGWKLIDRVALAFLLLCSIALGAACGLLFVYASDLPEIRALETYRPNVVTEIYADDGQMVGSFALQRRILMTYEQCPKILFNAVTSIEDQHFEDHWGVDFPRIAGAAYRNLMKGRKAEGASTITMQLAGNLFLDRSDRSFRRKMQEMLLSLQIERRYTKPQIFTMYANQVYLAHGNYGFAAAAQFYFGKPVTDLKLQEAALLAGDGERTEVFTAAESGAGAFAAKSGAAPDAGRGENQHHGRNRGAEDASRFACAIPAKRFGSVLF
jgi:penicillin-binding protein 1A